MHFNILAIGDVVGPAAVEALEHRLYGIRARHTAHFTVVNGENAAIGNGLDVASAKSLLYAGADVLTTGNHVWQKREIYDFLRDSDRVIRPANYPSAAPGAGYTLYNADGVRILVMNVMGCIYMEPLDDPFVAVERILDREKGHYDISVLDIHAEATGEKLALAKYFDGRISVIFGTHTHVQTADACILKGGTGYITDLGMTGPIDSILGVKNEIIIEKLRTKLPRRFEIAEGPLRLCGAVFTVDTETGVCLEVQGVREDF